MNIQLTVLYVVLFIIKIQNDSTQKRKKNILIKTSVVYLSYYVNLQKIIFKKSNSFLFCNEMVINSYMLIKVVLIICYWQSGRTVP